MKKITVKDITLIGIMAAAVYVASVFCKFQYQRQSAALDCIWGM